MMIGPAPMIMMEWMSVRLGIGYSPDEDAIFERIPAIRFLPWRQCACGIIRFVCDVRSPSGLALRPLFDHFDKAMKQVVTVARPGTGLGMILHTECRPVGTRQPLVRTIEQRDMCRGHRRRQRVQVHGKAM